MFRVHSFAAFHSVMIPLVNACTTVQLLCSFVVLSARSYGKSKRKEHVEKYIQWVTTLSLKIRVYLHSFSCCCLANMRKFELIAVQGHPKSTILESIESACNFLLVINSNFGRISATVFQILTFKATKWLVFPTPLFGASG